MTTSAIGSQLAVDGWQVRRGCQGCYSRARHP
jgi:hypothetical protein